jgi:hypothetical protein
MPEQSHVAAKYEEPSPQPSLSTGRGEKEEHAIALGRMPRDYLKPEEGSEIYWGTTFFC